MAARGVKTTYILVKAFLVFIDMGSRRFMLLDWKAAKSMRSLFLDP